MTPSIHKKWWKSLSPLWQQAFAINLASDPDDPSEQELNDLIHLKVLRLTGPTAPFPNCKAALTDLSGITALKDLEILILTDHRIESVEELGELKNLKSLFLQNNEIKSLHGIENLKGLELLYIQSNKISSIKEIAGLLNLKEMYVNDNLLDSLEGLTEAHSEKLKKFICLPNEKLPQKAIIFAERELGVMCR